MEYIHHDNYGWKSFVNIMGVFELDWFWKHIGSLLFIKLIISRGDFETGLYGHILGMRKKSYIKI